jgi:Glycosyl transferase family 2/Methyltransferase domain
MLKLNLGCSDRHLPGYVNVDVVMPADFLVDLSRRWPWEDSSVDEIVAEDIIEHLQYKITTMNELWRVLKPGGRVRIAVPTTDGPGAFQDPTHVSFWNRRSFLYYEAGNIYRERFAKAYGIEAAFRVLSEHIDNTMDGPRLTIDLAAVKAEARAEPLAEPANPNGDSVSHAAARALDKPSADVIAKLLRGGTPDVLGVMRIKNEAQWIHRSIESQLVVCDKVLVLDDGSTDGTQDIVRSFGDKCVLIQSPFTGVNEGRDKRHLLQHVVAVNPTWALWIDGDEVLEDNADKLLADELAIKNVASYLLPVLYFWDSLDQYRVDGVYANFHRASLFRVAGQATARLHFATSGGEADLHNGGNCPQGLDGAVLFSKLRIKHYGYLTWEQRQKKYEWYNRIDPNNEAEDCYRHIVAIPGARHAPGPTELRKWEER